MKRLIVFFIVALSIILLFNIDKIASNTTTPTVNVKSGEDFTFFIVSDPHYMSDCTYDNGEAFNEYLQAGNIMFHYSPEFMDAIKENVMVEKPEFVVFTGDLTCNGLKENHYEFSKKLAEIRNLGTDVYVIPGNHDIGNREAMYFKGDKYLSGDNISKNKFVDIYGNFGYNQSISRDKDSLSYLVMATEDIWLLMLDATNEYPDQGGALSSATLKWIEKCYELAKEKNSKMIAVMHHSLIDHSQIISKGYTLRNSQEALECFYKCEIEIVLTGHIHLQDIKQKTIDNHTIYDIATSSISIYPHQYGTMYYSPKEGFYYNTVRLDMTKYAIENELNDEFLINFENYAESFFKEKCCKTQRNCIYEIEELDEREKRELIKVVSEINKMYFAGYRNEELDYLKELEGYKLLEKISSCPVKDYTMSILYDERSNNNKLLIPIN